MRRKFAAVFAAAVGAAAACRRLGKAVRRSQTARRVSRMVVVLMTAGLMLAIPQVQSRAAGLIKSVPKPNAVVRGPLVVISLHFDVPVDHRASRLTLKSRRGVRHLAPSLAAGPMYLAGTAGGLAPGTYKLVWVARLASGHTRSGTIRFTVR